MKSKATVQSDEATSVTPGKRKPSAEEQETLNSEQTLKMTPHFVKPVQTTSYHSYTDINKRSLETSEKTEDYDEHDLYCASLAYKLRRMDEMQRLFAEKIINDSICMGKK